MLYGMHEPSDITIAMDLAESRCKCFAQFPTTLSVQTFVMSLPKSKRCFYEVCIYSTKHSICIEFKDKNKNDSLLEYQMSYLMY